MTNRAVNRIVGVALCLYCSTAEAAEVNVGSASGFAGQEVRVSVTLNMSHLCMDEFENTIGFSAATPVLVRNGRYPFCVLRGGFYDLGFHFGPPSCVGSACTEVSFVAYTVLDSSPPDGKEIYACKTAIQSGTPPGDYPLVCIGQFYRPCFYFPGNLPLSCSPGVIHVVNCSGDCNRDGNVSVDELVRMVRLALDESVDAACEAGDVDGNGVVTIDEILRGLTNSLDGCGADGVK